MAELSLAEKAIAALWAIESPTEQIRILKQNDKQFEPSTNFHPLRTDVLDLLFKMIIKPFGGGSEDASSRLDPALKALKLFATLASSMEHPLQVYTVDVWSTKINFLIGSQIAESAEKAGKRLPVRSWLLTIVENVYNAIFTEYRGIPSRASCLDHAAILNLLYTALFHRTDQAHGDPNVRQAIFKSVAKILVPHSASGLSFPEVTSNAVMKYGPKRILERCTNFLNRGFVLGTTTLIAQLSQVPAAYEPIFVTGRFHVRLMEKYWVYTKNPSEDPEAHSVQSVTLAMLLLIGMLMSNSKTPESLQNTIIRDLVTGQDLMFLVGRSFVHYPVTLCDFAGVLFDIRQKIVELSQEDAKFQAGQVKPSWFSTYQWVKIASRSKLHQIPDLSPFHKCTADCSPKMVTAVDWWLAFGGEIGFDIFRIEVEYHEAAQRAAAPRGSVKDGCAWFKCSLYGEQASVTLLRCCNCKSMQYCSLSCQKRDWLEGNHKASCKI